MSGKNRVSLIVFVVFVIVCVALLLSQLFSLGSNQLGSIFSNLQRENVKISIAYAPELDEFFPGVFEEFENQTQRGKHPVTGENLDGNISYTITPLPISSGTARTHILNALQGASGQTQLQPTIYAPTASSWMSLINYEQGVQIFPESDIVSAGTSPVGIAIWESRLRDLKQVYGENIGYAQIQEVSNNGWKSIDPSAERNTVYGGFTDPTISTTSLSALIMQYQQASGQTEVITATDVSNPTVQGIVQKNQESIKHYSKNTVVFREYLSRGPDYIDFLPLAENDLIFVNQGRGNNIKPSEKLVMLYPSEGSVIHNYPLAIPNADWITEEERKGAELLIEYLTSKTVQEKYRANGIRPVHSEVPIESPISSENGITVSEPQTSIAIPSGETISEIQLQWDFVKKPASVTLLVDTSGSMNGEKISSAKQALEFFIENLPQKQEVGLTTFDSDIRTQFVNSSLESNTFRLQAAIAELRTQGSTKLYDGILEALEQANNDTEQKQTKAIIVLSDGQDTESQATLRTVVQKIEESQQTENPVLIIPVAYGADADTQALQAIARASRTTVQSGNTDSIEDLFGEIASYF